MDKDGTSFDKTNIPSDALFEDASLTDRNKAKEISQIMGGLPLALDQAGAYIEETTGAFVSR